MSQVVYLPCSPDLVTRLRSGDAVGPWLGFTASAGLRVYLAEGSSDPGGDELEYAALNAAGIAHLVDPRASDLRLVLAADVEGSQIVDLDVTEPGAVTLADLGWRQVTAMFSDEVDATAAVAVARRVARGRTVLDALALSEVAALLEAHDLLWFAPAELDALL